MEFQCRFAYLMLVNVLTQDLNSICLIGFGIKHIKHGFDYPNSDINLISYIINDSNIDNRLNI